MELIKFFNENYLIILSGLLGLFLFKWFTLYKKDSQTSNNDSTSNDTGSTNSSNNGNNTGSHTDSRERTDRAVNYAEAAAVIGSTVGAVIEGAIAPSTVAAVLTVAVATGALGYHLNNDLEQSQIDVTEPGSPGHENHFNLSSSERNVLPNNQHQDTDYVPSPNENENDLFDFFLKCYDAIKEGNEGIKEFVHSLIANDGDPTMFYLFSLSIILFCILIIIFSLTATLLIKRLKLEEKEWIKNKKLLHKIVLGYNQIKEIKIYFFLGYLILSVLFCLLLCNFMWASFWHYK